MRFELSIINGKAVFDVIRAHRAECIEIVRDAYLAYEDGRSVNPDSYFLRFPDKPDCRIIALPAYLGNGFDVAGLKWIASYPANIQRGFPRASAVLVLNSYDSGYPFAILESSIISAARTAASAVLAAYWLSGDRAGRIPWESWALGSSPGTSTSSWSIRHGRSRKYGCTTGRLPRARNSCRRRAAPSGTARSRWSATWHS